MSEPDAPAPSDTRPRDSAFGEPLVDAAEVAAHLGVDKTTVYRLASAGELPSIEIAPRVLRFRPQDVRAFLERRSRKSPRPGRVKSLLGKCP